MALTLLAGGCDSTGRAPLSPDGGPDVRTVKDGISQLDGAGGLGGADGTTSDSNGGRLDGSAGLGGSADVGGFADSGLDAPATGRSDGPAGAGQDGSAMTRLDGSTGVGGADGRPDVPVGTEQDGSAGGNGADGRLDSGALGGADGKLDGTSSSSDTKGSTDAGGDGPTLMNCSPLPQCQPSQLIVRINSGPGSGRQQCACETNPCGTAMPSCTCAAALCTKYAGTRCQGYSPGAGFLDCMPE